MIPLEKWPFKGRTYFFDLRFYRNQDDLSKNIKKLGGKIETFLCEEVTHVITDRSISKSKLEPCFPGTPKSRTNSINDSGCCDVSMYLSPTNENKQQILSRGQALLQKAKLKNQAPTDIYGLCDQLKIKIVPLQKVITYIDHYKECLKRQAREKKEKKKPRPFFEILNPPFIKIEDKSRIFRPVYKSFSSWKGYFHPSFLRVANEIQEKYSKNVTSPFKSLENIRGPVLVPKLPNPVKFISPNTKLLPEHIATKKVDGQNNSKDKIKKNRRNLERKQYCEICSNHFRNLEEHLRTRKHKEFQCKIENFRSVSKVNALLPTIDEFLKKNAEPVVASHTITRSDENKCLNGQSDSSNGIKEEIIQASCNTESSDPFPCLNNSKGVSSDSIKIMDCKQVLDIYSKWSRKLTKDQLNMFSNSPKFKKSAPCTTVTNENSKDSIFCHETFDPNTPDKTISLNESEVIGVSTCAHPTSVPTIVSSQNLEKNTLKHTNIQVSVMNCSQFPQTVFYEDSMNVMLNINGCSISRYPFRNFGFGSVNNGAIEKRNVSPSPVPFDDNKAPSLINNIATEYSPVENYSSPDFENLKQEFENFNENKFNPLSDNACDNFDIQAVKENIMLSPIFADNNVSAVEFHTENDHDSEGNEFKILRENIDDLCHTLCICNEQPIDLSANFGAKI